MAGLSDLELCIIGVVGKRSPCTAYMVLREFADSPSSHWSASAGAVYPAVKRLCRGGYLRERQRPRGSRTRTTYGVTAKGRQALIRWLTPPVPAWAAAITYDPVRTRVYFLGVLTPAQRLAFLKDAEAKLVAQTPIVQSECDRYARNGDRFSQNAMRGALEVLRARIRWVRSLRRTLAVGPPSTARQKG